jgi:glutathione S-transferase
VRLYDYGASANCLKVRILLRLLDVPYEPVPTDIFAGESQTSEHLSRNPAGRTPVLELDSGEAIPESNAILFHLARGTAFLPDDPVAQSRVLGWLFFEQNLVEPNIGTARFWKLTGRDAGREQVVARFLEADSAALDVLERQLDGREWLVGDSASVADVGIYAYAHVAPDAGVGLEERPAVVVWLTRIESLPGFANDLEPYPPGARAGVGGQSVHDGPRRSA